VSWRMAAQLGLGMCCERVTGRYVGPSPPSPLALLLLHQPSTYAVNAMDHVGSGITLYSDTWLPQADPESREVEASNSGGGGGVVTDVDLPFFFFFALGQSKRVCTWMDGPFSSRSLADTHLPLISALCLTCLCMHHILCCSAQNYI